MLEIGFTDPHFTGMLPDSMRGARGTLQLQAQSLQLLAISTGSVSFFPGLIGNHQMMEKNGGERVNIFTPVGGWRIGLLPEDLADKGGQHLRVFNREKHVCHGIEAVKQIGILYGKVQIIVSISISGTVVGIWSAGGDDDGVAGSNMFMPPGNVKGAVTFDDQQNVIGKSFRTLHQKGAAVPGVTASLQDLVHRLTSLKIAEYVSFRIL